MATVSTVRFNDDTVPDAAPLSDEERAAVQQRLEKLKLVLADEAQFRARYKIELLFSRQRSLHQPVPGVITFWESGTQLHGGGDARVYLCPGKRIGRNDCSSPMPFDVAARGVFACPRCGIAWQSDEERALVIGEVFGRHTMQQWSALLLKYFRILDHNCDIYLKHSPEDIRSQALLEKERDRGGELLGKARKRAKSIYPLRNIIKDMSAGADPYRRFFAFVTA